MYEKIIKYLALALLVIGAALTVWGYVAGFTADGKEVDTLLIWAYIMVGVGIAVAVLGSLFASVSNNPKVLLKLLGGAVVCAVLIGGAYLLASGDPLPNHMGTAPAETTLKLTDTILNLTYLACIVAVVSVIGSLIWDAIRSK